MNEQLLKSFSDALSAETDNIINYLYNNGNNDEFKSDIFDEPVIVDSNNLHKWILLGRSGLYIFMITKDMNVAKDQAESWNSLRGARFKLEKDQKLYNSDCWYLGSCTSKSLYSRIKEHYSDNKEMSSLKLGCDDRSWIKDALACYAFPIKKEYSKDSYILLLRPIEQLLHEALIPVCGSKRV